MIWSKRESDIFFFFGVVLSANLRVRSIGGYLRNCLLLIKNYFIKTNVQKALKYRVVNEDSKIGSLVTTDRVEPSSWRTLGLNQPLVIAMVGLPARGKSYIVKMLRRYLVWNGYEAEVFNVGSYRRKMGLSGADSNFFSNDNKDGTRLREELAMAVQSYMYTWLKSGDTDTSKSSIVRVAIFDATNTTVQRRQMLCDTAKNQNVSLLFVESICDDKETLERNYKLKLANDDYKGVEASKALADFIDRVHAYEKVYHTVEDSENGNKISYIKLINVGQKVITRNCHGFLPSQVAFYLQNIHINPRKIYLTLPAESYDSVEGILGGDSGNLTAKGRQYSIDIARYIQMENSSEQLQDEESKEIIVLTGTAKVDSETVNHLALIYHCFTTPLINELRGGDFNGMKRSDIQEKFPLIYHARMQHKLTYRYPGVGGESYMDVIERIRPVIIELERQRKTVVLVCHLAVLRCIYAYFNGNEMSEVPNIPFEYNQLIELIPGAFQCSTRVISPSEELKNQYMSQ